jgi:hypothetical protein
VPRIALDLGNTSPDVMSLTGLLRTGILEGLKVLELRIDLVIMQSESESRLSMIGNV